MSIYTALCKLGQHIWRDTFEDRMGKERQCIVCGAYEHALNPEVVYQLDNKWHWIRGKAWRPDKRD